MTGIQVSCSPSGDDLMVAWKDNGIGIPEKEKELIYDRGFGKTTEPGMFPVLEILSLTRISFRETEDKGKGARFRILIPKAVYRSGSEDTQREIVR